MVVVVVHLVVHGPVVVVVAVDVGGPVEVAGVVAAVVGFVVFVVSVELGVANGRGEPVAGAVVVAWFVVVCYFHF